VFWEEWWFVLFWSVVVLSFLEVGGSTFVKNTCAACCRISEIAAFAVSANDCGDVLLSLSYAISLQIVGVILATF